MRLINADALIETMKRVETEYEDAMTRPSWWTAYSVISEQPTAYDVEKVVAEIHKTTSVYGRIPKNEAIDIVKGVVWNEENRTYKKS
jgi:hypothetical protein